MDIVGIGKPGDGASDDDIFDPNNWDWSEWTHTIWTPRLEFGFRVDYVDYVWAIQWLWDIKRNRRTKTSGTMFYCSRNTKEAPLYINRSIYLHIEIMKRTGIAPPSPEHKLVDHIDGDTFNCRRRNLQWATHVMNRVRGNKSGKRKT